MSKINKIKLSGTSYDIEDKNAPKSVEVTQAEYDALVSGGTVDPNTFYIITDASAVDMTQYYTSAQTESAITAAVSGKIDTSAITSAVTSASTDSEIPTAKAVYDAIPTGGTGGGKAIEAGRGISVTTGETADTVSISLPISANTNNNGIKIGKYNNEATANASFVGGQGGNGNVHSIASGNGSFAFGNACSATSESSIAFGGGCLSSGYGSFANGGFTTYGIGHVEATGDASHAEGNETSATSYCSHSEGYNVLASNKYEHSQGAYNISNKANTTFGDSGNTLFSVGNGTADNARHNAFEIRQNGDIYISYNGNDVNLQDLIADIYSKLPTS